MANPVWRLWRSLFAGWRPYFEKPIESGEISHAMHASSIPTFGYYFMLSIATAIATFGLLANSAPAIIGAMIIAPLMGPIMSLAFGLVCAEWRMIISSTLSVLTGVVLVVLFAYLCTEIIGLRIAGSEILSRSSPTSLDLGVAMAAGAAGAFAHSRKSILNSIAGVAIAVALVPPLAVVGIGLALGYKVSGEGDNQLTELGFFAGGFDIASGALVLFLTNLIGIIAVAAIVFLFNRYGRWKQALASLALSLVLLALILQPLNEGLYRLYVKSTALRTLTTLIAHERDLFTGRAKLNQINVNYLGDRVFVDLDMIVANDDLSTMQERVDTFRQYLAAALNHDVEIKADVVPVEFRSYRATSAKPEEAVDERVLEDIQ